ncbi:TonB-dependent receptor [Winogradskyella costae]|uniref:TonB-dependent receptor n=1 Tax=Winogradskyella costae TaxID=2697008 RepID=UPI0015C75505|nr:Plug domain-containing protein [Winogradskyella costae]
MRKGIIYCTLLLLLTSFVVRNDNNFNLLVKNKLENYTKTKWPEKIYVQTDKLNYTLNDSIWFAAYLVNGVTHLKSTRSNVLYVELINNKDSIVDKKKLHVTDLSTKGDFTIKENWSSGKYILRAYTNYMRNENPNYFFQKKINIWSPDQLESFNILENNQAINETLISEKPELNFYPEGGHLVDNVASKVAVKIENTISSDTEISGYITDNEANIVTNFKIIDIGLGLFSLKPIPNKNYVANLELNGIKYSYPLPKALPKGYNLNAIYKSNNLLVDINSTTETGLSGAYIMIHQRGKILYEKLLSETKNSYALRISANDIPDGVAHLTLFNADGNPVCERLVFIENKKNQGHIKIKNDTDIVGTKEKVTFLLNTEGLDKSFLSSQLSLSVRHVNTLSKNGSPENIKTWLLLNSDLRGEIKNPSSYFLESNDNKRQYLLDLVMLTNGWRRFTWQNLLYKDEKVNEYAIEKGIIISGNTKLLEKPYTLKPAYTSLTFLSNGINVQPAQKSGVDGKFSFGPFEFYDSIPIIIQSRLNDFKSKDPNNRALQISVDDDIASPDVPKLKSMPLLKNDATNYLKMTEYISDVNFQYNPNSHNLDEVLVIGNKKEVKDERDNEMDERSQFGFPSFRLDVESDATLSGQSIQLLLSQLPGLTFDGTDFSSRGGSVNPKFIVDDVEVDIEDILYLTVDQVSFIDFYKGANAAIYSNSSNGVIVVYTKIGSAKVSKNTKRKPGIINFSAKGFYTAKEFYSPNYSNEMDKNFNADVRTTLYWNPNIRITDQNTVEEISFFTGDIKGDYSIEIEGISESGIPLYQTSTFSVE